MNKIIVVIALLICANTIGQELKKKTKSELFYEESYSIDKSTKKRQGDYLKVGDVSGDTLVKGQYEQDSQVGIWSYMGEENTQYLTFNYDEKKLIKIANKSFGSDSIQIKAGNSFKMSAVDHPAIYLGFKNEIERNIRVKIKPPPNVFDRAKSGVVMISFEINKKGEAQNFKIETSYDKDLNKALEKSVEIINEGWFPASVNGDPVVSKMYMMCNVSFIMSNEKVLKSKLRERSDLIVIEINYSGSKR